MENLSEKFSKPFAVRASDSSLGKKQRIHVAKDQDIDKIFITLEPNEEDEPFDHNQVRP